MSTDLDRIWLTDQLDRRPAAVELQAYIESIGTLQLDRGADGRGFTIAVDAPYGVGKTFFLRRLAEQLELSHPVAFVDAWADDILDEPLTALAATLREALTGLISKRSVKSKFDRFLTAAGKVALVAAKGAAIKGASAVIGAAATQAVADFAAGLPEAAKDVLSESVKDSFAEAGQASLGVIAGASASKAMTERIKAFNEGKDAITSLKSGLKALVDALPLNSKKAPIIIVIDELDRCKPTYAVKFLEEIKHLFDVPGLVFVLGMNADQLSRSVVGAYGPQFDGTAYLRRFINREYVLQTPDLSRLLSNLIADAGISQERFIFPEVMGRNSSNALDLALIVALYMANYGLSPRDCFQIVDFLQTVLAISGQTMLLGPYILPIIMRKVAKHDFPDFSLPVRLNNPSIPEISYSNGKYIEGRLVSTTHTSLCREIKLASEKSINRLGEGDTSFGEALLCRLYFEGGRSPADTLAVTKYDALVERVGAHFKNSNSS